MRPQISHSIGDGGDFLVCQLEIVPYFRVVRPRYRKEQRIPNGCKWTIDLVTDFRDETVLTTQGSHFDLPPRFGRKTGYSKPPTKSRKQKPAATLSGRMAYRHFSTPNLMGIVVLHYGHFLLTGGTDTPVVRDFSINPPT